MVEHRQESGQTMALGRPPMPGLLQDMKLQKTMKPKDLTAESHQDTTKDMDNQWYERSHSKERIDVRKSGLQETRKELETNLFGQHHGQEHVSAFEIPPAPSPPPRHHKSYVQRKKEFLSPGSTQRHVSGRYSEEGDTLIFQDGLREMKGLPRTMRAAVVDSFDDKNPNEALVLSGSFVLPPRMEVDADEVMVHVEYCGINMEDQKRVSGIITNQKIPFIPGRDGVGKIVRLGNDVQKHYGFNLGDNIMGISTGNNWGTYGEYAVMKASQICLRPPTLPIEKAATLPSSLLLAFEAFHKVSKRIDSIKRLLILDNGHSAGVSSMLILLAKFYFMTERVIVACPSNHLAHYKQLGADICIDMDKEAFEDVVMQYYEDEVRMLHGEQHTTTTTTTTTQPLTGGQPPTTTGAMIPENVIGKKKEGAVDLVIDTIGGLDTQPRAYKLLSKKGTFIAMAFPRDVERSEIAARMRGGERFGMGKHMLKSKFKSYFGGTAKYEQVMFPDYDGRRLKSLVEFLTDKQLLGKIQSKEFSFEQLPEAMHTLNTTPYEGKIIVDMTSDSMESGF